MTAPPDPRLGALADLVLQLASGDYSARGEPSPARDDVDAVTVGLNLLAETLQIERRAREQAEALLRDAVHAYDHAPGMFCSVDSETLQIVKCNATFAAAIGLTKEQLFDRRLLDVVAEEDRPKLLDALRGVDRRGEPRRGDFSVIAADGKPHPVLFTASMVADDERRSRIRIILRDVTQERSLEAQLRQAQKMEAVGRLASGVAHDFNNLLTVVLGAAEHLGSTLDEGHRGKRDVEMILEAAERAALLTRQLLTFGRADVSHLSVHDLNTLVRDAHRMLVRALGEQVHLELELADTALSVRLDATQLTQVLLNLAINARDAMSGGGRITLTTRLEHDESGDGWAVLSVDDTGSGMTPEVLEHAFEPFFTTKEASHGSGLGLAVCYAIVGRAGGSLELTSTLGRGTTARIALPLSKRRPSRPVRRRPRSEHPGRGERLLVVDDSVAVRKLMARTLTQAGYAVDAAEDGTSALEIASRGRVDLLVTDVVMPGIGGVELARQLWSTLPGLPVVFVSGYTGDRLDVALLAESHVRFLPKPFLAGQLTDAVHELLALRQTDVEP